MKIKTLISLLVVSGIASAQSPSSAATREIGQLFTALENSQCEFYRNGSWYSAQRASDHLRQKYNYLLKKHLVTSAESFIDRAATQSSMSGKPYQVRCNNAAPVSSKSWFTTELNALRAAPTGADSSFKPKPLRGPA